MKKKNLTIAHRLVGQRKAHVALFATDAVPAVDDDNVGDDCDDDDRGIISRLPC